MRRRIDLAGCHNFRDLGGYPAGSGQQIRWRQLFRSDALHDIAPEGVERFVVELGIGVLIDLRSTGEIAADGVGPLADQPLAYHHLALFDGALDQARDRAATSAEFSLADRYYLMAEYAKEPIARVLSTLARATAPAVYHCAAGKDRTGVISAILLGVLGVRDEVIVADYAASQENLDAIVERLLDSEGYREMLANLPADTLHAEPETMVSLLEQLREKYGSVGGYARSIGVTDAEIELLRERLLEDG